MNNGLKRVLIFLAFLSAGLVPFYPYQAWGVSFFTIHALSGLLAIKYQIAQSFLTGEYPLWNTFILNGVPFHSGIGIFDPFLISFLFFDGVHALLVSSYLALCVAGLGMYLYLHKGLGFSIPAALLGGLFYLANPFFAATCHENPFMNPPVFLPFIFYFYETAIRDRRLWKALLSGIFLGCSFLAGNLESFYFIGVFFVTLEFCRIAVNYLETRAFQAVKVRLIYLTAVGTGAFLFMAVDLLPTVAMIFNSGRNANTTLTQNLAHFIFVGAGAVVCAWGMQKLEAKGPGWQRGLQTCLFFGLIGLFVVKFEWRQEILHFNTNMLYPLVHQVMIKGQESFHLLMHATGVTREALQGFMEPRFIFYIQPPIYLFTMTTFLIFSAVFLKAPGLWLKTLCWYAVLFIIFPYTSVPNLNDHWLKMKDIAYPRIMFAFFFVITILLAHGFQTFLLPQKQVSREQAPKPIAGLAVVLVALSFLFFLFCLMHRMNPDGFETMLKVLHDNPGAAGWWVKSRAFLSLSLEALSFLSRRGSDVLAAGALKWISGAVFLLVLLRPTRRGAYCLLVLMAFEFLGQWNLYTFQKTDIRYAIQASRESEFLSQRSPDERVGTLSDAELDLLRFYDQERPLVIHGNMPGLWHAKTIDGNALNLFPKLLAKFWKSASPNTKNETAPGSVYNLMGLNYLFSREAIPDRSYRLVLSGDYYQIYKNMNALPRFYFARSVRTETEAAIGVQIQNAAWSPADVTLIESAIPDDWVRERRITAAPGAIATLRERFNTLRLRTQSESSEFLATTEAYHRYWKVYVDGKKSKPVKINYYFRGVFLAPGEHEVEFRYEDPYFTLGLAVTLSFLIFFIFVLFRERTKGFLPVSRHG